METFLTAAEHLEAAEGMLVHLDEEANPLAKAAVAQAHALMGVGLLLAQLADMLGRMERPSDDAFQTVRIVGGLGPGFGNGTLQ